MSRPLSEKLLVKLPPWVRVPVKCRDCWRFDMIEPWEIKWVVPLCRKHVYEEMDKHTSWPWEEV